METLPKSFQFLAPKSLQTGEFFNPHENGPLERRQSMIATCSEPNHNRCTNPGSTHCLAWLCITGLAWFLLTAPGVRADGTTYYCYYGHHFTSVQDPFTTNDSVYGCLTLSSALSTNQQLTDVTSSVTWISFADGVQGEDNHNPFDSEMAFATHDGQITAWIINFMTDPLGPSDFISTWGDYTHPAFSFDYGAISHLSPPSD